MCDGLGYIRSNNTRYGCHHIGQTHQYSTVARSYVQVVAVKARQGQSQRTNGNGEEKNSCHISGAKVAANQKETSSQSEGYRCENSDSSGIKCLLCVCVSVNGCTKKQPFCSPLVVMILLTMPVGMNILNASAINPPVGMRRANRTYGIAE